MVACCPGELFDSIVKQFYSSMVKVKPGAKVITIEPAQNALTIEWVVRLFSVAFGRVCALKVVDKLAVNGLTHELTAAEVTAVFEKLERLLRLFFRITAASSRSSGRNDAVSVVLRLILRILLIRGTRARSSGASRT